MRTRNHLQGNRVHDSQRRGAPASFVAVLRDSRPAVVAGRGLMGLRRGSMNYGHGWWKEIGYVELAFGGAADS
jgi:hypothetical protein